MNERAHDTASPPAGNWRRGWLPSAWPLWLQLWAAIMALLLVFAMATALLIRFVVAPQYWDPLEQERRALWRELRAEQRAELRQTWEAKLVERFPERFPDGVVTEMTPPSWSSARRRRDDGDRLTLFLVVACCVGAATYLVARGLTRRLERLREGVDALAGGDLTVRIPVSGGDEIAQLAFRFNAAATRIESLVQAHKDLLAHTSHELRTPLTRLRLSLESPQCPEGVREVIRRELDELNGLIDQILLASRLDHAPDELRREPVDLLGLLAEEATRTQAEVDGQPVVISADEFLLRRLVRNLLENAARHAPHASVKAQVARQDAMAVLTVCDDGPGISEADRARVFDPFFRAAGAPAGGSGLGLALVLRIATLHGGQVRCLPGLNGRGTRFEVSLPLN